MAPKRNQNGSKSRKKSSKEALQVNAMAECVFPQDLMIAILARLPVKSLVRFKCVCKPWRSLVSNPNFVNLHSSQEATALLGFDSANMEFKAAALPNLDSPGEGLPLVNWKGSIAALDCVKRDGGDCLEGIDLWCYQEPERVWSRKQRFVMMPDLHLEVDQCLDCSSSGKIVGGCTDGKLFTFDPATGRVRVTRMKKRKGCSFQLFAYYESLAYVKEMVPAAVSKREEKVDLNDIHGFFVSSFRHRDGEIACYFSLAQ